jgi:hypothetical protein
VTGFDKTTGSIRHFDLKTEEIRNHTELVIYGVEKIAVIHLGHLFDGLGFTHHRGCYEVRLSLSWEHLDGAGWWRRTLIGRLQCGFAFSKPDRSKGALARLTASVTGRLLNRH